MPPNQQPAQPISPISNSNSNNKKGHGNDEINGGGRRSRSPLNRTAQAAAEAWPTKPGSTSPHLKIPDAPSMAEIQNAFTTTTTTTSDGTQALLLPQHPPPVQQQQQSSTNTIAAAPPAAATGTIANHNNCNNTNGEVVGLPVRFMGYMDEKGIIHSQKLDSSLNLLSSSSEHENNTTNNRNYQKKASVHPNNNNNNNNIVIKATAEEEKQEILSASAEDILQASLNFERSYPEKRYSSSLDHFYAVSTNLYPSLEDCNGGNENATTSTEDSAAATGGAIMPPATPARMTIMQHESSTRQESTDSVRTTCTDVVNSASAAAAAVGGGSSCGSPMACAAAASAAVGYVVPEPPGSERETTYYAIASVEPAAASITAVYKNDNDDEEEEDVKIGVARAQLDRADTDSPAAVAAAASFAHSATATATTAAAAAASLNAGDNNNDYYNDDDDNNNVNVAYYASAATAAEATVLGTSETDEEALLAKLAAEDEELLALKRSAYWGGYEGTPYGYQTDHNHQQQTQQATVVSITEHDVHPSEISHEGAVRAELIGEDYNDPSTASAAAAIAAPSAVAALSPPPPSSSAAAQAVYSTTLEQPGYGYGVVDSQATVIDTGEGTTSWPQAEEATVLSNDDSSSTIPYSERKLPAVATTTTAEQQQQQQQSTTPKRNNRASDDYLGPGVAVAAAASAVASAALGDAEVIAVTEDPYYEHEPTAAAAAYGNVVCVNTDGTDYGETAAAGVAYASAANVTDYGTTNNVAYADGATVSSIAYADNTLTDYGNPSTAVAYSDGIADGIAEVYHETSSSVAYAAAADNDQAAEVVGITEEYHPAEVSGNEAQAELVAEDYGAAMAYPTNSDGNQAEVVGITEDFHPAEVSGNEAQAELVAEEYGAAVALPSTGGGDDQAEVVGITEDFHPAEISGNEAQAELVGEDYGTAVAEPSGVGFEATALPDEGGDAVQAATVVGYEDEGDIYSSPGMMSRASTYGGTAIPDRTPPSARAYTAPAAVGTRIDPVCTPLTPGTVELDTVVEEDWMRTPMMRTPSVTGDHLTPMKPPVDGDVERPAVVVAALDAYADAPTPVVDDTVCCSPSGYSEPAVAVMSLDAYATAPATPIFDDTDCSMVNRRAVQPEIPPGFDASESSLVPTEPPTMPPPRSFNSIQSSEGGSVSSATSAATSTTTTTGRGFHQKISNGFSTGFARGMEMLFGDTKPTTGRSRSQALDNSSLARSVMSRQLLPWSVIYSEATNMWVATVNTNQKALDSKNVVEASKSLRAFSVVTEKQATCLAKAWSPPRMHDFKKNNACHICKAKFAVFRRACHCRNCGVAICVSSNGCSRPWPAKMCPETYNIKKESFLNVCAACDFLCTSFRLALLEGDRDKAIALHATGNINIVTPFANVKGELFYPVHCAALGGNLELLKWLVDENCCPIKSVRVSGRCRDSSNSFTEISTSKGRSLLGIALENRNVGIVRYLVVEKGIQLSGEKDVTMENLCRNLELVLRLLPEDAATGNSSDPAIISTAATQHHVIPDERAPPSSSPPPPTTRGDDDPNDNTTDVRAQDTASDGSVSDACIICFDRSIDCVATPCGHQVCCLNCSTNITRCPVCAVECSFMRVFRP